MSGKRRGYPKNNVKKYRQNIASSMDSEPTEEYRVKEDGTVKGSYQNLGLSQVPTEESKYQKFFSFFSNWGAVVGGVTVFVVFIVWFFSVRFELDQAKDDISSNKANIQSNQKNIQKIEISTTALAKDVHYMSEKQDGANKEISEINRSIKNIKLPMDKE